MDAFEAAVSGGEEEVGERRAKNRAKEFSETREPRSCMKRCWLAGRAPIFLDVASPRKIGKLLLWNAGKAGGNVVSSVVPHPAPSLRATGARSIVPRSMIVHSLTDSSSPILDSTANLECLVTWNSLSFSFSLHSLTFEDDYFVIFPVNNDWGWLRGLIIFLSRNVI